MILHQSGGPVQRFPGIVSRIVKGNAAGRSNGHFPGNRRNSDGINMLSVQGIAAVIHFPFPSIKDGHTAVIGA
ncbi:hypothetical protein, partial [uncultured Akkermansia sp.]|uniref:hypothetical protein n=1 Tax=uncultured Akkermansia sp. TaxID=512294 RepID=UPI00265D3A05